jgi:hypothetical protein
MKYGCLLGFMWIVAGTVLGLVIGYIFGHL